MLDIPLKIKSNEANRFYTRLGANFHTIFSIFSHLYGERLDFPKKLDNLVKTLAKAYIKRSEPLKTKDTKREKAPHWFLSQKWVGMALPLAGRAKAFMEKIPY